MKCPEINPEALRALNQLTKFWSFPRKKLTEEIKHYIDAFQNDTNALHKDFSLLESNSTKQLTEFIHLNTQREQQQELINKYKKQIDQLQLRKIEDAERIGHLETLTSNQRSELQTKHLTIAQLREAETKLKSFQNDLRQNLDKIEVLHMTLQEKFALVQSIIALEAPVNKNIDKFKRLIHEDYLLFASRESSLANEAGALIDLQAIQKELELITAFPSIYNRTQIAIAGGFSSGKSQFINSFIKSDEMQLAVGINPVTVVPSYIICSSKPVIRAYGANRGSKDLSQEIYKSLSHEYVDSLGFDLRKIMPFITVEVCMEGGLFEHICLIDTPGYNPGRGQVIGTDHNVAQSYAQQASAMIWVIGLDTTGTISKSDLEFIDRTNITGEYLYILLNKADARSEDAINDIIDQVECDLLSYGLEAAGICAYSSRKKKAYQYRGQKLEDFLRSNNQKYPVRSRIEKKIDDVFIRYQQAIRKDISTMKKRRIAFDEFKIEALQHGGSNLYQKINTLSAPIESDYDFSDLIKLDQECDDLRKRLKDVAFAALDTCTTHEHPPVFNGHS